MKKILETDLMSLAHKILQMKDRENTKSLLKLSSKIYEKLLLLDFYEENQHRLNNPCTAQQLLDLNNQPTNQQQTQAIDNTPHEIKEQFSEQKSTTTHTQVAEETHTTIEKNNNTQTPPITDSFSEEQQHEIDNLNVIIEDSNILEIESVFNPDNFFENTTPKQQTQTTNNTQKQTTEIYTPVQKTINDAFNKNITIGLNDRIAFEKNLFNGKTEDLNRVISALNTFQTHQEAIDFIEDLVKPDFNNWKGKEEYEQRFLELIAKRFA